MMVTRQISPWPTLKKPDEKKGKKPKKEPPRCLFCNKVFEKGEPREMVKRQGEPPEFFHFECFDAWRATMKRGG